MTSFCLIRVFICGGSQLQHRKNNKTYIDTGGVIHRVQKKGYLLKSSARAELSNWNVLTP